MLGIDTNVLLYSLNPASRHQQAAERFLRASLSDRSRQVALADYVLVELYNHLRNKAVMKKPLGAKEAVALVTGYWKVPNVLRIEHATVMDEVWKIASESNFARRRIFDVRLAKTLLHHGVTEFATANVKDFEGLGFAKVWSPVAD